MNQEIFPYNLVAGVGSSLENAHSQLIFIHIIIFVIVWLGGGKGSFQFIVDIVVQHLPLNLLSQFYFAQFCWHSYSANPVTLCLLRMNSVHATMTTVFHFLCVCASEFVRVHYHSYKMCVFVYLLCGIVSFSFCTRLYSPTYTFSRHSYCTFIHTHI